MVCILSLLDSTGLNWLYEVGPRDDLCWLSREKTGLDRGRHGAVGVRTLAKLHVNPSLGQLVFSVLREAALCAIGLPTLVPLSYFLLLQGALPFGDPSLLPRWGCSVILPLPLSKGFFILPPLPTPICCPPPLPYHLPRLSSLWSGGVPGLGSLLLLSQARSV